MLMLFRPSFCANCGERIERAEWSILTSRRFCAVCEIEYKGHEWLPRAVIGISVLIGIFGFGSYLNSGSTSSDLQALRQPRRLAELHDSDNRAVSRSVSNTRTETAAAGKPAQIDFSSTSTTPAPAKFARPKTEIDEPINYCGAETKKGTPCSRRVKGNIRCYQHAGMPAMTSVKE